MKRKNVWEPGVPAGWCVERKTDKGKFDKRSFRTVCFDPSGKRATKDTGATRCVTIGCPMGHWKDKRKNKKFKTSGVCVNKEGHQGGTRVQRVITRPGHYGCHKKARPKRKR